MGVTKKAGQLKSVNSRIIQAKVGCTRIFCAVIERTYVNEGFVHYGLSGDSRLWGIQALLTAGIEQARMKTCPLIGWAEIPSTAQAEAEYHRKDYAGSGVRLLPVGHS